MMVMSTFPSQTTVISPLYSRVPISGEEEQPMYVNAKQYHRILKRRAARARQEASLNHKKRGYLHTSRHNHACKRPRGEGGRFLSKDKLPLVQQTEKTQEVSEITTQTPDNNIKENENILGWEMSGLLGGNIG